MPISRFRHTQCQAAKPENRFIGVSPTHALWDGSNTIACNDTYVAVPWSQLGSTAVFQHNTVGKVDPHTPLLVGQGGPIIDVSFSPFDRNLLFTASEDGSVWGWRIPRDGLTETLSSPQQKLNGHSKKCGTLCFHPSANNVLASGAVDRMIHLWDIEKGTSRVTIDCLADYPMGLDWNLDGSLLCTTTRDKKLCTVDPRDGKLASSTDCNQSARSQRCIWAKRKNLILTLGFDYSQRRQVMLWDPRVFEKPLSTLVLDQASAALMPSFDEDTNLLFLSSRGEGGIRCFELMNDALIPSFEYLGIDVVRGMCLLPKWSLDVRECEVARAYQLTQTHLFTVQMLLPRKQSQSEFQADVYPPTFADEPALSAGAFFDGQRAPPLECNLQCLFSGSPRCVSKLASAQKVPTTSPEASTAGGKAQEAHKVPSTTHIPSQGAAATGTHDVKPSTTTQPPHLAQAEKHADPLNMEATSLGSNKKNRLGELLLKLKKQQREVETMRAALVAKEEAMLETIKELQEFA